MIEVIDVDLSKAAWRAELESVATSRADRRSCLLIIHRGSHFLKREWVLEMTSAEIVSHVERSSANDRFRARTQIERAQPLGVSVIVCTALRRVDYLRRTLHSILAQECPAMEVILVDNSLAHDVNYTEILGAELVGRLTIVQEPKPGLSYARNRGLQAAHQPIVAFTDDDVVVPPHWITALTREFVDAPEAMGVMGLIVPFRLDTDAQMQFEMYKGGFGNSVDTGSFAWEDLTERGLTRYGVGYLGAGANLSFRREALERIGGFDGILSLPGYVGSADDIDMMIRCLDDGATFRRSADAFVFHDHRSTDAELKTQLFSYGKGITAVITKDLIAQPTKILSLLALAPRVARQLAGRVVTRKSASSGDDERNESEAPVVERRPTLALFEIAGMIVGPYLYLRARRAAAKIVAAEMLAAPTRPEQR